MAKRILVPLDAMTEHDAILPLVADLARGAGATVRLLHVSPVPHSVIDAEGRVIAYADQEMQRLEVAWMDSVRPLEALFTGVALDHVVRFGDPVAEILAEAEAAAADLIAVTTTCRNAVKRTVLGSVAEQLVRRAPASVLLLRAAQP